MLSIIILTHNSEKFISACIDSVFLGQSQNIEVIVVDNGSQDSTLKLIRLYGKQVRLIANKQNLGPCCGRNQAISQAKGDWILTLDCDVVLDPDFLDKLQEKIKILSSNIGMLQPKILTPDRQKIYSCGVYLSWNRRFFDMGHGQKNRAGFGKEKFIFGPCAAAALYRKSMLLDIKDQNGYFDETFFFFVEDVDIAWRAQRKGWKCLFTPEIKCTHVGNSTACDRKLRQYYCLRNRYYMIKKNEGLIKYWLKIIPVIFYDLPRIVYIFFKNPYFLNNNKIDRGSKT